MRLQLTEYKPDTKEIHKNIKQYHSSHKFPCFGNYNDISAHKKSYLC